MNKSPKYKVGDAITSKLATTAPYQLFQILAIEADLYILVPVDNNQYLHQFHAYLDNIDENFGLAEYPTAANVTSIVNHYNG